MSLIIPSSLACSDRSRSEYLGTYLSTYYGNNERLAEEEFLVEGINDAMEEGPARRRRIDSGVGRRNANIDFGAGVAPRTLEDVVRDFLSIPASLLQYLVGG